MRPATLIVLIAMILQGCAGGKPGARSMIPDCEDVSANARPDVDCMNRPDN